MNQFERTISLIGQQEFDKLQKATVAVIGVGGVGSVCCECLVRSGIGHLIIIDNDIIAESNLNRQIQATKKTIGLKKVDVLRERMLEINPNVNIKAICQYIDESNVEMLEKVDYVVDAIDSVKSKIAIYEYCQLSKIKIVSCLGMAKRLDPTKITITKLKKTENDPLAAKIRHLVRQKGLSLDIDVIISKETPHDIMSLGSMMMVPSAAGLALAYFVIDNLIKMEYNQSL